LRRYVLWTGRKTARGADGAERHTRLALGGDSEGENLDGIGMKQGRKGVDGITRREVEKTWGRSTVGRGIPGAGRFPQLMSSKGEETSWEGRDGTNDCHQSCGRPRDRRGLGDRHKKARETLQTRTKDRSDWHAIYIVMPSPNAKTAKA